MEESVVFKKRMEKLALLLGFVYIPFLKIKIVSRMAFPIKELPVCYSIRVHIIIGLTTANKLPVSYNYLQRDLRASLKKS